MNFQLNCQNLRVSTKIPIQNVSKKEAAYVFFKLKKEKIQKSSFELKKYSHILITL